MALPPMTPVKSSNLAAAGYDSETNTMYILFRSGHTYKYTDIPAELFNGMMAAPSPGKFFYVRIRDDYSHQEI